MMLLGGIGVVGAVLLGVVVLVLLWGVAAYNGFVGRRNLVKNAWAQIDVQLRRRHDLIPNLVESVKGGMAGEKGILENVMKCRQQAVQVAGKGPAAAGLAEGMLTQALGKLFAVVENYPNLKSIENVSSLMEELKTTENRIGFARQHYNDQATAYNTAREVFPGLLIARLFAFEAAELFELDAGDAAREVPKVNLSLS